MAPRGEIPDVLASKIVAKGVTFQSLMHPSVNHKTRDKVLHASGLERLADEWMDPELANREAGIVARLGSGLVTALGRAHDSTSAMRALEYEFGHRPGDGLTVVDRHGEMKETLRLSLQS